MLEIDFEFERPRASGKGSRAIQAEIDAAIVLFLDDIADFARNKLQELAPEGETGRLHESIFRSRVEKSPGGFSVEVGIHDIPPSKEGESPQYPLFVEHGTGRFGRSRRLIRPTHGNVMVFEVDGRTIFTHKVKGQRGQHFVREAEKATKAYFKVKKRILAKTLGKIIAQQG